MRLVAVVAGAVLAALWAAAVAVVGAAWIRSRWQGSRWGDWSGPLDGRGPLSHTGPRPGPYEENLR